MALPGGRDPLDGGLARRYRQSYSHGPMLPPDEETLVAAHRRTQAMRIAELHRAREVEDYDRRIATKAERAEYIRAAMACPICDRASNGNVCASCLHSEAVSTRDLLEGFE